MILNFLPLNLLALPIYLPPNLGHSTTFEERLMLHPYFSLDY